MIEFGMLGRVRAVPTLLPLVLMGTNCLELVLAAYTVALTDGVTLAVTTFWLYSAASPILQVG